MNVEGKVALITGGGAGIGRATALALARRGCAVVLSYLEAMRERTEHTAREVVALGVTARALPCDVTRDADCRALVAATMRECGRLDILVNNAGVTRFIPHADLDALGDEDWDLILGVNVKGTFHCARAAAPAIAASGGGEIINVASIAGIVAVGSSIPYAVSKSGVITLTKALARVLAPKIRVNAVAPGFVTGEWMRQGLGDRYEQAQREWASAVPLERACQPEDVADAIMSLITGSDLVTGQTLVCDGGALIVDAVAKGVRGG
ncbi:MAG: SDR family NAD(P)-dependent oxidoreductase [Gemmataceae bacterium]